jgi:hypothetical protein
VLESTVRRVIEREVVDVDLDDEELQAAGLGAYGVLESTVRRVIEREVVDVDLDDVTWMCWSTMQGLVTLEAKLDAINERRGGDPVSTRDLVRRFTAIIIRGVHKAQPAAPATGSPGTAT